MPSFKKKKSYAKRPRRRPRAGVRKRSYRRRTVFRPQNLIRVGFPRTTAVRLRYVTGLILNPTLGNIASHVFRANSCFDPDSTAGGHQPMNFDMWSTLYNHYIVVGSKISCNFLFNSAGVTQGCIYGIMLTDDVTYSTDPTTIMEQGLTRYKVADYAWANGRHKVSRGFSCKKFFNVTNPLDNTDRLGATVIANPNEQANFVVFVGPTPSSSIDLPGTDVQVVIEFTVIFSEPKEQPLS